MSVAIWADMGDEEELPWGYDNAMGSPSVTAAAPPAVNVWAMRLKAQTEDAAPLQQQEKAVDMQDDEEEEEEAAMLDESLETVDDAGFQLVTRKGKAPTAGAPSSDNPAVRRRGARRSQAPDNNPSFRRTRSTPNRRSSGGPGRALQPNAAVAPPPSQNPWLVRAASLKAESPIAKPKQKKETVTPQVPKVKASAIANKVKPAVNLGMASWSQLVGGGDVKSEDVVDRKNTTAPMKMEALDPLSLDSSRHGLPLLLKQSVQLADNKHDSPVADVGSKRKPHPTHGSPTASSSNTTTSVSAATTSSSSSSVPCTPPAWTRSRSSTLIQRLQGSPPTAQSGGAAADSPSQHTNKKQKLNSDSSGTASPSAPMPTTTDAADADEPMTLENKTPSSSSSAAMESPRPKQEPPKPLSPEARLKSRQKQITLGKVTVGYQEYIKLVPRSQRRKGHPRTPDPKQDCSKRSWSGQVKKWRRLLHQFDPPAAAAATTASEQTTTTAQESAV